MADWGTYLALAISLAVIYVLFTVVKKAVPLLLNGVLGILLFWALAYFKVANVPVDWVTFLVAAFGGIIGVAIVVIFSLLGIPL